MEDFKGMSRSTTRSKTPPMKWEHARNILLTKGYQSVTNENGFDYIQNVPGECIGIISTNEEVVCFSVDGDYSYIGYIRNSDNNYIPVLKSIYLGFKIDRPIEGVFFYNFKKELIVAFCDGIFEDSNIPKLINLTNIGVALDVNLELVDPNTINQLLLTPTSLEGDIEIDYEVPGSLDAEVVYVTYAYVLADGVSTTGYFLPHEVTYPTYNFNALDKSNLLINITNLDTAYSKVKIGLVVLKENGLIGYVSNNVLISNGTVNVRVTSLESYTEENVDNLVVGQTVYKRIKTMTMTNDQMVIGNLVTSDEIPFQKYANMLRLGLWYGLRKSEKSNEPLLCPDEVYSFSIALQYLDGTYSKEYHIPGEPVRAGTGDLDDADLVALGIDYFTGSYKNFHIKNSGTYKVNTMPCNVNNLSEREMYWGYWENEEVYPDEDENYNSLPLGGEDLTGKPIRYHRVPGLDKITDKLPSSLGVQNFNTDANLTDTINKGVLPSFEVNVLNFDSIVPPNIKSKIQGFKLSIAKRIKGDTLVEDINFAVPHIIQELNSGGTTYHFEYNKRTFSEVDSPLETQFGRCHIRSNQFSIYKQTIASKLVKFNYAIKEVSYFITDGQNPIPSKDITLSGTYSTLLGGYGYGSGFVNNRFIYKPPFDVQQYAYIQKASYQVGNNIADNTYLDTESIKCEFVNKLSPFSSNAPDVTFGTINNPSIQYWNPLSLTHIFPDDGSHYYKIYSANTGLYNTEVIDANTRKEMETLRACVTFLLLNKNVYTGFKPIGYVTIGKVSLLDSTKRFDNGGDVFTNNAYNVVNLCKVTRGSITSNYLDTFALLYAQTVHLSGISTANNSVVYSSFGQVLLGVFYELGATGGDRDISEVNGADLSLQIFNKESFRLLNDLIVGIPFDINDNDTNVFPYRIHRSLKIGNETIETNNIRTFLPNNYRERLNDRGEIIALRGSNRTLYIQQKYSLFIASIKDTLQSGVDEVYLGQGDIFDRDPIEVFDASNKGYIGCTSQFAAIIYKNGYVVVDQVRGKIFAISDSSAKEISNEDMGIWFNENADTKLDYHTLDLQGNRQRLDNPFTQVGHLIGYDDKYRRLLFTKKLYEFLFSTDDTEYTFDGSWYYKDGDRLSYNDKFYFKEVSYTFSYDVDSNVWICEHDYYPNAYSETNLGLYTLMNKRLNNNTSLYNSSIYKHNSLQNKAYFYEAKYESFIDLIFNQRLDLKKLYQAWNWITEVEKPDGSKEYFKTIDAIMCYTDFQCSGIIDLSSTDIELIRNTENEWNFNGFRDVVIDSTLPILDKKGFLVDSNIAPNRSWFNKGNFINNFIVTRMIMKNVDNNTVYIHVVNVKSRTSDR